MGYIQVHFAKRKGAPVLSFPVSIRSLSLRFALLYLAARFACELGIPKIALHSHVRHRHLHCIQSLREPRHHSLPRIAARPCATASYNVAAVTSTVCVMPCMS
jgi:hypothetical protein